MKNNNSKQTSESPERIPEQKSHSNVEQIDQVNFEETSISPLKRWKRDFCRKCDCQCAIGHERFITCILCGLFYTIKTPPFGKEPISTLDKRFMQ